MYNNRYAVLLLVVLLLGALSPLAAQDGVEVVVDGLVNPRQLSFDSDGNLWVAEAGNAGPHLSPDDTSYGASGQIRRVTPDGSATVEVAGLMSYREGASLGAHDVIVTGDSIWILLGESAFFNIPFTHALVELDRNTKRVKTFVDLLTPELELAPDGNPNQQSNPVDFTVAPDGTVYIANAGCNCLMSWRPETGVEIVAAWPFDTDNPVPTTVAVDASGDIYVSFLTGFPFPAGASRVEKWSGGALVETYTGLSTVTSILVTDDGTIYAVEAGLNPDAPARVVEVTTDGPVTVADGLVAPYGIAQGPDGRLYVTVGSQGGQGGAVVVLP